MIHGSPPRLVSRAFAIRTAATMPARMQSAYIVTRRAKSSGTNGRMPCSHSPIGKRSSFHSGGGLGMLNGTTDDLSGPSRRRRTS